ncbi:MAG: type III pantothenate kinase [Desulfosarcinaceae bacterium]|nr:type III pantothenate kinase [Desulfosarcinaceae bacterium]
MLLVIDVGNTNTVMGIFVDDQLVHDWRIRTERNTTEDEYNVLVGSLFTNAGVRVDAVRQTVISSVVPPMATILDAFCCKYLGHAPHWVNAKSYTGMPIRLPNPDEVGADRIVNAVGAYHKHQRSMIIIDFGTATTFDAISPKGEYLGGAISPGIMVAAEALFMKASKLPRVEIIEPPEHVIGKGTNEALKSGIIYGYAGLVEGVVKRMRAEMGGDPMVIATGGLAKLMGTASAGIDAVEPDLTLEGLRIIAAELQRQTDRTAARSGEVRGQDGSAVEGLRPQS